MKEYIDKEIFENLNDYTELEIEKVFDNDVLDDYDDELITIE